MYVINRDNRKIPFRTQKIVNRISTLSGGLNVDPNLVAEKTKDCIKTGISTMAIDEQSALICAGMSKVNPDYVILAARISRDNLRQQTVSTFSHAINVLYLYDWNVEDMNDNAYPDQTPPKESLILPEVHKFVWAHRKVLNDLTAKYILRLDYFGFQSLKHKNLLKVFKTDVVSRSHDYKQSPANSGKVIIGDGGDSPTIVELPEYMYMRYAVSVSRNMGAKALQNAVNTYTEIVHMRHLSPPTPATMNAGMPRNENYISCFVLSMDDSISGIARGVSQQMAISARAGGVGFCVSNIRATGSYIRGTNGTSNGVVEMLGVLNSSTKYVNQGGNKRPGSTAIYIEPWHADIVSTLRAQEKNKGSSNNKTLNLFYGWWIPDLFMRRALSNESWSLFDPDEAPGLHLVWGKKFDELYTRYEDEGRAKEIILARDLLRDMYQVKIETGKPYIMFKDAVNSKSNHQNIGTITSSNLCVSGGTCILTDKGQIPIKQLEKQTANVWNGEAWSSVIIQKTGLDQKLIYVLLDNGAYLLCTPYHKFYDNKGIEIRAGDLKPGSCLEKCKSYPVIDQGEPLKYAYTHGLFCAEGSYTVQDILNGGRRCTNIAQIAGKCLNCSTQETSDKYPEDGQCRAYVIPNPFIRLYREKKLLLPFINTISTEIENVDGLRVSIPDDISPKLYVPINANLESKLLWFAGFCDGAGTVSKSNRSISCASINLPFLQQIKLMLQTIGCDSNIKFMCEASDISVEGIIYKCQQLYRLSIVPSELSKLIHIGFSPNRFDFTNRTQPQRDTRQYIKVINVADIDGIHDTFCFNEPLKHRGVFNGLLTGNCTEITLHHDTDNIACCILNSVSIGSFVRRVNNTKCFFDYMAYRNTIRQAVTNLEECIDLNYYPDPAAERSAKNQRALGIGWQGFADAVHLMEFDLGFEDPNTIIFNEALAKWHYYCALEISCELAKVKGPYALYKDSPVSKGILQCDMYAEKNEENLKCAPNIIDDVEELNPGTTVEQLPFSNGGNTPVKIDWIALRKNIAQYGIRHSQLVAMMPTAGTAQIFCNSECFDPYFSNIFVRETLSGKFTLINTHLAKWLQDNNLWTRSIIDQLWVADGSIQKIDGIPNNIKIRHKTIYELSQRLLMKLMIARRKWVCQAQSFNLYFNDADPAKLHAAVVYAWLCDAKNAVYYLHSRSSGETAKVGISVAETQTSLIAGKKPVVQDNDKKAYQKIVPNLHAEQCTDSCGS